MSSVGGLLSGAKAALSKLTWKDVGDKCAAEIASWSKKLESTKLTMEIGTSLPPYVKTRVQQPQL